VQSPFAIVVDADPADCLFFASTLTATGADVIATRSFRKARSLLLARPPNVLIVEVRPGKYDGLHLARLGRCLRPHMVQLVTSEFFDWTLYRDASELAATIIHKPMTTTQLLCALYRTMLRDPGADGTVAPLRPQLVSSDGACCREAVEPRAPRNSLRQYQARDTFLFLEAWRRPNPS
jgi:DNA-binding response OmpR family regulator